MHARFPKPLCLTICTLLLLCGSQLRGQELDLLIRGGEIIDGTGSAARPADIGISGDRIVFLGKDEKETAKRTIDAHGLIVAPGFIDPHTHTTADLLDPKHSRNDAYLTQGVTTVVTGNDGQGPVQTASILAKWERQGIGTNAAIFIGQGAVRREVLGMSDAKPTAAQLLQMQKLVDQGMKQGAIGLSTGLYYAPGSYANTEEVITLAKTAASDGGIYDTHIRDESTYSIGLLAAIDEAIRIGKEAHIPVMISHIKALGTEVWGKSPEIITEIEKARSEGLNITASQYPYTASGTSVEASLVPRWAEVGGRDALLARFEDPSARPRLVKAMEENLIRRGGADSLLITATSDKSIRGKTLAAIAQERNRSPVEAAIAIIKEGGAGVASFNMQESDIEHFMQQPWVMTCSDGVDGHPRKFGTYPRKLRRYVYDKHVISLEFAIHSSTELPAQVLGFKDRGLLKTGYFADIVIFDPKTIADRATYESPSLPAAGIQYVLVNGKVAVDNGTLTSVLAGRVLKHTH